MTDTTTSQTSDFDGWATAANALVDAAGRDSIWIDQHGDITGNAGDLARVVVKALNVANLRSVVEDARYEVGNLLCIEGECEHAEEHDVPCPLVENRYATADDVIERDRLRDLLTTVREHVGTDADGEIDAWALRQVLAEFDRESAGSPA